MDSKKFHCDICGATFVQNRGLHRHEREKHGAGVTRAQCPVCPKSYVRRADLDKHLRAHDADLQLCHVCGQNFKTLAALANHLRAHSTPAPPPSSSCAPSTRPVSPSTSSAPASVDILPEDCDSQSALQGCCGSYKFHVPEGDNNIQSALASLQDRLRALLDKHLITTGLKWYLGARIRFVKAKDPEKKTEASFSTKTATTLGEFSLEDQLRDLFIQLRHQIAQFQREGSDWTIDAIISIDLNVVQYLPLRGSSYIVTPSALQGKRALINIKNEDNKCFAWSVLASLHPKNINCERPHQYRKHLGELNLDGLEFPMKISQVAKFERQNDISVCVFGYEKEVFPLYISQLRSEKSVDLLLISEDEEQHYCCISNLSRLLGHLTKHDGARFYCRYCLHRFCREDLLIEHSVLCTPHGAQKICMPQEKEKWMRYSNFSHQMRVPYTVYADFECFITKLQHCGPNPTISSSTPTSLHIPCGFAYTVVGPDGAEEPVVYRDSKVVDTFVEHMLELETRLGAELDKNEPLVMTIADEALFRSAVDCHICKKPLGDDRVRDHCHLSSKFRGAAHEVCNINYKVADHIPIIFHGLRNYDSHLIMQGLGKVKGRELTCIPNHTEKYISFSLGRLRFIDSFQFMSASLETLTNNLVKDGSGKFNIAKKWIPESKLALILRKGVYPYTYVDGEARFRETSLPPKSAFFNDLKLEEISEEDYAHAQMVWDTFQIEDLGQYHDLYLKTDVILLADVFENFRLICSRTYDLDPCHFFTAPGLAWAASLKTTGVQLELLTEYDMYLFVEEGIRGGVSMISTRHAVANNKYMSNYDPSRQSSHIMYMDANNLYGWAMSLPLPIDSFRWLDRDEIEEDLDIPNLPADGGKGYIMCVDLEYPSKLHDTHNCYPLAPESMEITEDMLSPHSKNLNKILNSNFSGKVTKLVPNLRNKTDYIVHYRNLQLYLSLGLKLTKIHKVLEFRQTPWLKPYIELNTNCRKNARDDFEKDFFKLMNNAVFGKTMENLRNRVDVKLVQERKKLLKLAASPAFRTFKIFDENLVAVDMRKQSLFLNRPIYAGFAILDLSKTLMYDFHYNYIKPRFGDKATLLFTDTDSLTYHFETEDIYLDFQKDKHLFDFSGYPKDHFLYSEVNKKVIGKMKDEMDAVPITEFVGLRPKLYSIKYGNEIDDRGEKHSEEKGVKKTAKGVSKSVIKKVIRHENYKRCLLERETLSVNMTRIVSERHQIYTSNINKLALSSADDKRYILEDGIHTLAHGHYKINETPMDESI